MNAPIIRPDTCQTCPFKVRKGDELECHGNPPVPHPVIVVGEGNQPKVIGIVTVWPKVAPDTFCGMHPKRRLLPAESLVAR